MRSENRFPFVHFRDGQFFSAQRYATIRRFVLSAFATKFEYYEFSASLVHFVGMFMRSFGKHDLYVPMCVNDAKADFVNVSYDAFLCRLFT